MKPNLEKWNIVLSGAWNVAIFSPHWIGKQFKDLFHIQRIQVEYVTDAEGTHIRCSTDDLMVIPASDKLIIGLKNAQPETMVRAERMARKILTDLPHTPIFAFGINFGFIADPPARDLLEVFELKDTAKLTAASHKIQSTTLTRALGVGFQNTILNMTIKLSQNSSAVSIDFNFHHEIKSAGEASSILAERVRSCEALATNLLTTVYGLEIEDL